MSRFSPLVLLGLAWPVVASTGCDVHGATTNDVFAPTVSNLADGGEAGIESEEDAAADAGEAAVAQLNPGSPLCVASPSAACYPNCCHPGEPTTAEACDIAPDGGPYNAAAGYSDVALACRVVASSATAAGPTSAPTCSPTGTAGDGAWCKSSTECAAQYDCVGSGTCQRYCCSGNTDCVSGEFCDVQSTAQASTIEVPVCMPIHPQGGCTLLDPGACTSTAETCAVVRENGATSCVPVGSAKAHDGCDETHCAAGLVCLGAPGERQCYQLCHTASATECTAPLVCTGGLPLFPDSSAGICQ